jgi:hypothetical protein
MGFFDNAWQRVKNVFTSSSETTLPSEHSELKKEDSSMATSTQTIALSGDAPDGIKTVCTAPDTLQGEQEGLANQVLNQSLPKEPGVTAVVGDNATGNSGTTSQSVASESSVPGESLVPSTVASESHLSALEAFNDIKSRMPQILSKTSTALKKNNLPLIGWGPFAPRVQQLELMPDAEQWYFIGDLHNDFLAWHCLFNKVKEDPNFRLCFVGDLVDRGPHHLECFAALLDAAFEHKNQILWILGNHDEGVKYSPREDKKFSSTVVPSEFASWLNEPSAGWTKKQLEDWGTLFVDVCAHLPRAALFSDGLLATHGGIPLEDRWGTLKNIESFNHTRTLDDFTWTRAASEPKRAGWMYDSDKRKRSSDFEFGYKDFNKFCQSVAEVFPVKRAVRGHDHVESGAQFLKEYTEYPVLTLNGFGFDYLTNSVKNYRKLALGVGVLDELPRVEYVSYSDQDYEDIYGQVSEQ